MLVSIHGRYALRVLLDLAENGVAGFVPMKDVAARQEISLKYLEWILPALSGKGLIDASPGKGGYRLCRKPEEYTVGEILRLTEKTWHRSHALPAMAAKGLRTAALCPCGKNSMSWLVLF